MSAASLVFGAAVALAVLSAKTTNAQHFSAIEHRLRQTLDKARTDGKDMRRRWMCHLNM